jgi:hypothetical protein
MKLDDQLAKQQLFLRTVRKTLLPEKEPIMSKSKSSWPGILSGLAALIIAITGGVALFYDGNAWGRKQAPPVIRHERSRNDQPEIAQNRGNQGNQSHQRGNGNQVNQSNQHNQGGNPNQLNQSHQRGNGNQVNQSNQTGHGNQANQSN